MRISDWSSDVCSSDLCGLVAFTVRNGIGSADPILIDTAKNVIVGRGAFSFRDESMEFGMRADAKRSEERRVRNECVLRVNLCVRCIINKKKSNYHLSHT